MGNVIDEASVRAAAGREWAASQTTRDEFGGLKIYEAYCVANARGLAKVVNGRVRTMTPSKKEG